MRESRSLLFFPWLLASIVRKSCKSLQKSQGSICLRVPRAGLKAFTDQVWPHSLDQCRTSRGLRPLFTPLSSLCVHPQVLGIVFFLFLIMWCPFFITNVTSVLCRGSCDESLLHDLLNVFVWVGYISSGVNPLIYTLFNKTYRRAFSSYIRCRYGNGAHAAGPGCKPLLAAPQCPSHAVTPLLAGVDRNSHCRNGSRGDPGRLGLDPEDVTDDETQVAVVSHSLSEYHASGALSETEPETEAELSPVRNSPASREHTSSV